MLEGGKSGPEQRRQSLLSFRRDVHVEAGVVHAATSPTAPARPLPAQEVQSLHRAARLRREAQPDPYLAALAASPDEPWYDEAVDAQPPYDEDDEVYPEDDEDAGPLLEDDEDAGPLLEDDDDRAEFQDQWADPPRDEPPPTAEASTDTDVRGRLERVADYFRGRVRPQDPAESDQPTFAPVPEASPVAEAAPATPIAADSAIASEPIPETPMAESPPAAAPMPRAAVVDSRSGGTGRRIADNDTAPGGEYETWKPLIDPLKVIGAIVDAKWLILATTILGGLIGVGVALNTPKKYEAMAELLVDPRDLKLSDRDLTQQGLPSDATLALIENQVRIMTSGTVLAKVVDKLNLDEDSEFNGEAKSFGIRAFIAELRALLSRGGDDESRDDDLRTTIAIENLARSLSVERSGKTFVVTVAATTQSPEKSALIANTVTEVFLPTYGQIQAQTAGRATDELTASLDELRAGVEAAERKVAAFKADNDIIDPQGRLITDDDIVKLNEQLSVARARTLELSARAASARDADVDSVLGGAIPESINSSIITELRSQYASLKSEADRIAVRLGPRHPERLAIDAQVTGARDRLANELRRSVSSMQVELKRAVELEQQLAQRLAQLKVRQGDLSGQLVELRELERDVSTKRAVYEAYLLRAKETDEQRGINTANISVISEAYAPLDPTGPSRSTIAMTGMFLGFASGVGLAAMRGAYEGLRDRRREGQSRRRRSLFRRASPDGDTENPPPAGPHSGGPSGSDIEINDVPRTEAAERTASNSGASAAHAQDQHPSPPSNEDNPMLTQPSDYYYPVEQGHAGHPASAQGWAPPAHPGHFYAEPQPYPYAQPPHQPAPQAYAGHGSSPYPPQPLPPGYAPAAYPQAAYPQPAFAPPAPPSYPYAPPHHPAYAQPMPNAWPPQAQAQAPYPAPPAGYPHAAQQPRFAPAYPQQPAMHVSQNLAPVPAFSRPAAQPIPFPDRHVQAADVNPPATRTMVEEQASSSAIEDIRASLAEFREAVRDFNENRQKRRFF